MLTSYSQSGQDRFVYFLTRAESRYYLDVGCHLPTAISNTYALEQLGWKGLGIDCDPYCIAECQRVRKNPCVLADCLTVDWRLLLRQHHLPIVMDYLSFDIDEASLRTLKRFPFETYTFKVVTLEHDKYLRGQCVADEMRAIMHTHGYEMVCQDISNAGNQYEDWYIHPMVFDRNLAMPFRQSAGDWSLVSNARELSERGDRLGGTFTTYLVELLEAGLDHKTPLRPRHMRHPDAHVNATIKALPAPDPALYLFPQPRVQDYFVQMSSVVLRVKQDLVTAFRAMPMYTTLESAIRDASSSSPALKKLWPDDEKVIAIHLRLDDVADRMWRPSQLTCWGKVVALLNAGQVASVTDEMKADGCQCAVEDRVTMQVIERLQKQYPDHTVHIIHSPVGSTTLPFTVHTDDVDTALYNMMRADVLYLSHSTFPFVAALFCKGAIYYQPWSHYACYGLGTKWDRTNWTMIDDVKLLDR